MLQGEGDKAPVLLAHPLGLSEVVWQDLAGQLAEAGHPTLRYDLRGHGRSPNPAGTWGLAELAEDAARLIGEWGRGPVVMLGLSLGGLVAQQLAATRPELLRGLVLAHCDSRGFEAADADIDATLARHLNAGLRAARPDIEAALRELLLAQDPAVQALGAAAMRGADLRAALARWTGPTLVIGGALDGVVPPGRSRELAAALPGAQLCLLDGASHLGPVEQPAAFTAAVSAFLQQG